MSNAVPTHRERQIADLKPGDHVCSFYEEPADQLPRAVELLKAGLVWGYRCLYLTSNHLINEVRDALTVAGVNVEREQERGALRLLTGRDELSFFAAWGGWLSLLGFVAVAYVLVRIPARWQV